MNKDETLVKNFELLGYKIRLKPEDQNIDISPEKIVNIVRNKTNVILDKAPQIDKTEAILLVALELAKENLELESEFKDSVNFAQQRTKEILAKIEQVSDLPLS